MQHTKIDRWLCKKYVFINRIYFNTMPESLPRGLEIVEAEAESGARYKYRGTTRSEELAHRACETFAAQNITYTARIDERDTLLANFLGDPKRSVTMMFVWIALAIISILFVFSGVTQTALSTLLQDQDTVKAQDKVDRAAKAKKMNEALY